MSLINVLDIKFLNNPAPIANPYEIEIQFECLDSLAHDLEWKLIYVGSGFSEDVELDSLLVGPIPMGVNKFVFTADPVDVSQIPGSDVLGVSVILLTASYDDREFVRVGFYSNNEYTKPELREKYDRLLTEGTDEERASWKFEGVKNVEVQRNILTAKPRVTRFNIKWDNENFNDEPPEQEEVAEDEVVALDELGEGEDEEEVDGDGEDVEADKGVMSSAASNGAEGQEDEKMIENDPAEPSVSAENLEAEDNAEEEDEEELGSGSEGEEEDEDSEDGDEDIEVDEPEAVVVKLTSATESEAAGHQRTNEDVKS